MALKLAFGGCVFDDLNGDGIVLAQDSNGVYTDQEEPGLAGVIIRVFDSHGNHVPFLNEKAELVFSTTTDERGFYKIYNLAESCDYKIQFDYSHLTDAGDRTISPANVVVPEFINTGGSEGKDSDAVRNITDTIAETDFLTPGATGSTKVNLGLQIEDPGDARIGNFVFEDLNENGIQDRGEAGIAGIEVTLTGAGADGVFGTADDISRTKRTSGRGYYSFGHLNAGDYKVTFDSTDAFEFTQANVGDHEGRDSDADVNTGMTDVISLAASESNLTVDAGLIRKDGSNGPIDTNDARIGNFVFEDANGNGVIDQGEIGVAGINVSLLGAGADGQFGTADDIQRSTTTNARGFYNFGGLSAGDYKVTFEQPTGYDFTEANVGDHEGRDSDADVNTGMTDVISLSIGESNLRVDAGLVKSAPVDPADAAIGNLVFEDANRNGLQDEGEIGVAGVAVSLLGAGSDGVFGTADDITKSSSTDQNGFYQFKNLTAGEYKVTFDQPSGYEFTTANVGNNEGIDSDADVSTGMTEAIALSESERNFQVDAGLVRQNEGPDANNDRKTTAFETPVNIDVLGNDSDPDGDALSVTSLNGQSINIGDTVDVGNGKVTLLANGELSFTPDAGFSGRENFSYHVSDGNGGEDTAHVTVIVEPKPNAGPDANDDSRTTAFETSVNINVLGNDSDPDGDALSVTSLNGQAINIGDTVDVGNGTVTLLDNGQFSFTPDAGFSGNETFSYHVSDGNGGEDTANVTVTVDPKPNAGPNANNDSQRTAFETAVNINVLGNDSDPDGDNLQVTSIDGRSVSVGQTVDVGNGTATLLSNGQISFNPDAGFSGNETFSYHVSDGNGGEDTANVTVTVDPRPRKDIKASIVGAGGIDEGKSSFYKVQLDHAVTEDTIFTLDIHDGSAERVDRNDFQAANQDIMWGGYYSVGYVDRYGNWIRLAYTVDDRVANGTSLSSGDRPQIGPDGYTIWDYTVEKNGQVQNGGKVNVLVRAGQTMSEQFEVQTWKEKVTVDRAPWSVSTGYYEGTENFSIKLTGASGNDADNISLGGNKSVNIFDKTHYDFVSPLALDLNDDGVQTVAFGETEGTFDLNGDGVAIESGWLSSEDAFLAVDNNGNGKIDDISELFGGDVGEGFAKLATYDTNNDGVIDSEEILGGGLTLWQDANSNHRTDAGELISLASQGIVSLDTAFVETPVYQNGNVLIEHGSATKVDGSKIDLVDAYFQVADTSTPFNAIEENAAL